MKPSSPRSKSSPKVPLRRASDVGPSTRSPTSPMSPRTKTPIKASSSGPSPSPPSEVAALLEALKQQQYSLEALKIEQATVLNQQMVMAQNMALLNKNMVFMNGNVTALRDQIEDVMNLGGTEKASKGCPPLISPLEAIADKTEEMTTKQPELSPNNSHFSMTDDNGGAKTEKPAVSSNSNSDTAQMNTAELKTKESTEPELSPNYSHFSMTDDNGGAKTEKPALSSNSNTGIKAEVDETKKVEETTPPPEKVEETTPPEKVEETTPPEKGEDTTPPEKMEEAIPPEKVEDTTPPEKVEETTPPEKMEESTPPVPEKVEGAEAEAVSM